MVKEYKKVKVSEIIDAIKQNGFEHLRGEWISSFGGKITGGCVLGQGAVNLGVAAHNHMTEASKGTLYTALSKFKVPDDSPWVKKAREFNLGIKEWDAAELIVSLNDAENWSGKKMEYYLKTYDEVAQMVEDILTPFKNRTVSLLVQDYSNWKMPQPDEMAS